MLCSWMISTSLTNAGIERLSEFKTNSTPLQNTIIPTYEIVGSIRGIWSFAKFSKTPLNETWENSEQTGKVPIKSKKSSDQVLTK